MSPYQVIFKRKNLTIMQIPSSQTQICEKVSRKYVDPTPTYNPPSNIFWLNTYFPRYYQEYD